MDEKKLVLAADIISKSSRERPADAVLREILKAQRELWGGDATEISRAVFSFYRWQGWVESGSPSSEQIKQALLLAEQFRNRPESFSDAELVERAVPGWLQNEMTSALPGFAPFRLNRAFGCARAKGSERLSRRSLEIRVSMEKGRSRILWNIAAAKIFFEPPSSIPAPSKFRILPHKRSD